MQKHIIFTNGRSGSNYLANTLNLHPNITNYGEVLGDWTIPYQLHKKLGLGGRTVTEYLNHIYTSKSFFYSAQTYSAISHLKKKKAPNFKFWHQIQTLGIKDFSINFKMRNLLNFLEENKSIIVINLYRDNSLKRFLSLLFMQKKGTVFNLKK